MRPVPTMVMRYGWAYHTTSYLQHGLPYVAVYGYGAHGPRSRANILLIPLRKEREMLELLVRQGKDQFPLSVHDSEPYGPTDAGAMMRSSSISLSNCSGNKRLGSIGKRLIRIGMNLDQQAITSGCYRRTSHGRHLVAAADTMRGIGSIGRWESFLMTGMAEMSIVLRV